MSNQLIPLENESPHSQVVAILLCWFVGIFGVHRFYVGKFGTGLLQLVTAGGFGVWWLIDLVVLAMGKFRDADNRILGPIQRPVPRLNAPQRPIPVSKYKKRDEPEYDDADLMRDPLEDKFNKLEKDLRDGSV